MENQSFKQMQLQTEVTTTTSFSTHSSSYKGAVFLLDQIELVLRHFDQPCLCCHEPVGRGQLDRHLVYTGTILHADGLLLNVCFDCLYTFAIYLFS